MKNFIRFGTLGMILVVGIFLMAGCGGSTEGKQMVKETNETVKKVVRGTSIGQMAPNFELEKASGGKISFKDLEGSPAVMVFWTAWCPVCKEEAPKINKLAAEFENKGVTVVGVNIGDSDARISEGIESFGIKYTVAKDTNMKVSKSYKVFGTPTVIFLDKKGVVQYFGNEVPKDYAKKLTAILAG